MAPTHFINVDLEVRSRSKLDALVAELAPQCFEMFVGRLGGQYAAHYEVKGQTRTADATLRAFVRVIDGLGARARRSWRAATTRTFDLGLEAGAEPFSSAFAIAPQTIADIARIGGRIVVTVYAPVRKRPR